MSAIERHDGRRIPNRFPAGKAVMTAQKDLQKRQMGLAPFCDAFVIVTVAGDCDAGRCEDLQASGQLEPITLGRAVFCQGDGAECARR
jgi:hypothetical protein